MTPFLKLAPTLHQAGWPEIVRKSNKFEAGTEADLAEKVTDE
jgi:hypothetical protein